VVRKHEPGSEYAIRARYAIGADAAADSTVAEQLGYPRGTDGDRGAAMNPARGATRYTEQPSRDPVLDGPAGSDYGRGGPGSASPQPWTEWVLPSACTTRRRENRTCRMMAALPAPRLTIGDTDIESPQSRNVSQWKINHVIATELGRGRVFWPETGAPPPPAQRLGTNTSIQDAYNLAWKLAWSAS